MALGNYQWLRWLKRQGACLQAGRPGCRRGGDLSLLLRDQTGPGVHSTSYKMSTGEFPRGLRRPSVGLATLHYLGPLHPHPRGPSWSVMGIPLPFTGKLQLVLYSGSSYIQVFTVLKQIY